jgi:hypothetical protein
MAKIDPKDRPEAEASKPERNEQGHFAKGNQLAKGHGRTKGARNRLTLKLLERFEERNQDGISIEELMFDLAQGEQYDPDLRMKAAAKLADLVFPKTAQVELEIDNNDATSIGEIEDKIKQLTDQFTTPIIKEESDD